jgi:hypothetical protein
MAVRIEPGRAEGGALDRDGAPEFFRTGSEANGEYYCAECGYGVSVRLLLPVCPMCRGRSWEDAATSPFARSRA